jgi:hypothetical protein
MNRISRRTVLLLATTGLLAVPAIAEQGANPDQPKMLRRTSFLVKPDKAPEFQDLIRSRIVPAHEKNGRQMSTWRGSGAMGDMFRFTFVSTHDSFADFDKGPGWDEAMGEGAAATTWARFRDCITSMEGSVDRIRWDLSYGDRAEPVAMAVIVTLISAPGKEAEIEAFLKNDVAAAHKKVGSRGFLVRQNIFGGAGERQFMISVPIENYAELDKGSALVRALGAEGWAKLRTRNAPLFSSVEYFVASRVENLSTKQN